MSDLQHVIARMRADAGFRESVRRHPADALRGFALVPDDLRVIERELDGPN